MQTHPAPSATGMDAASQARRAATDPALHAADHAARGSPSSFLPDAVPDSLRTPPPAPMPNSSPRLLAGLAGLNGWAPATVWLASWGLMLALQPSVSLGNLALLMVLASAVASLWLRPTASILTSSLAVGLFNWSFVPPLFTFTVDLRQDMILLITMLAVSSVISYLMALTRRAADSEAQHQRQTRIAREHAQNQQLRNMLLTSISHDYRTPLTTVMSSASVIAEQAGRASPAEIRQLATMIVDEAGQLHRMATNTLQLARLDSQNIDLPMNWESLEEILGTVCARARRNHPQRVVQVVLPERMPLLRCDTGLLNQLFDNLIDNALKFSAAPAAVVVSAQCDQDALLIQVEDQGYGIPDAWKDRVFDIFQRVETKATPVDGGMRRGIGVGLAVCRAIAQVHHGNLTITDTAGGGTTVTLSLPLAEQPEQPVEQGA